METRHPVEGSFGNEVPSVGNHCGVYGGLKLQDVETNLPFWGKTTSYKQISKLCSERIHRLTDRRVVFKFRQIWPTGDR